MKEIFIILDGLMEKAIENKPIDKLILGNLNINYRYSTKDFSVEGEAIDSLNCIMNMLGYSPKSNNIGDRAFYEALSMGVKLKDNEVILRCNIIKYDNDIITDFTGGELPKHIKDIINKIKISSVYIQHIDTYKNLLLLKDNEINLQSYKSYPPHFHVGDNLLDILPKDNKLIKVIEKSKIVFKENNLNGCMLWPWGVSKNIKLESFEERYNKKACIITGIDMVYGMAMALGMKAIKPYGCNGYEDTNLKAKLKEVIKNIKDNDLVILHINGLDELAHKKDFVGKLKFLDKIREELIIPLIKNISNCKITITCDHRTDSFTGSHQSGEVPYIEFQI